MASGPLCRVNRPNTWLHRPRLQREENPCQLGAVHTWHFSDKLTAPTNVRYCGQIGRGHPSSTAALSRMADRLSYLGASQAVRPMITSSGSGRAGSGMIAKLPRNASSIPRSQGRPSRCSKPTRPSSHYAAPPAVLSVAAVATGPGSERGATMASHRFHIGQSVSYRPASRGQDAPRGAYEITGRLPQGGDGQFEYRIKHSGEAHERIAKESELSLT
jgi:hypothetical protein